MSKINRKTTLTAAVLAALMLAAPAAFAVSVTNAATSTLPVSVANLDVKDATTAVALDALNINVSTTDLIIGRTTGFSVRLDLQNGARPSTRWSRRPSVLLCRAPVAAPAAGRSRWPPVAAAPTATPCIRCSRAPVRPV